MVGMIHRNRMGVTIKLVVSSLRLCIDGTSLLVGWGSSQLFSIHPLDFSWTESGGSSLSVVKSMVLVVIKGLYEESWYGGG